MKLRPSKTFLLAGTVVVIIAAWLLMRQDDAAPTTTSINPAESSKSAKKRATTLAITTDDEAPQPAPAVPGRPLITLTQLAPWLERSGRSPEALMAAWELTQDPSLEAEMAEKHAGNPKVCLMLLQSADGTINQTWVDRLRLADPQHPLPDCLAAANAAKAGKFEESKAALIQALSKKSPLLFHEKERIAAIREAAAASGASAQEAAMAPSVLFNRCQVNLEVVQGALALARKAKQTAATGSKELAEEQAATAISLSAFLGSSASENIMQRLNKNAVVASASKVLPPETELGNSGITIAQYLEENKNLIKTVRKAGELSLETAPPADINAYWDQWLIGGEIGAMQWAIKRLAERESGK